MISMYKGFKGIRNGKTSPPCVRWDPSGQSQEEGDCGMQGTAFTWDAWDAGMHPRLWVKS